MKNVLFLLLLTFGFMGCSNDGSNQKNKVEVVPAVKLKQGKEYTSKYICPMHCKDSGSNEAGQCPVCGMDYVVNDSYRDPHEGHNHGPGDHSGHNH